MTPASTLVSKHPSCLSISLLVAFLAAGCHGNQDQNQANANPSTPDQSQTQTQDPASANLAPIPNASTSPAPAPQDTGGAYNDQGAPSSGQQYSDQQYENEPGYGEQAAYTAPDPPPPLPEYDQPDCPGDDYLWTPGYWSYAQDGYYWVPGAWVEAPYQGALWTPGYWGFDHVHRHYAFYHGYWGPHVGYYGGVNYGFGYVGFGYQGGYWNQGHFDYNRNVNRVNVNHVHYVYNRTVVYNNTSNTRISYNGGTGGINVRPRPAELAALHEQHAPPMTSQVQHAQQARTDRANFATMDHGHPANLVANRPLSADHNVRPPAQIAQRDTAPQQPNRAPESMRPNTPQAHAAGPANQFSRPVPQPNAFQHNQVTPQPNNRPANRPEPAPRPLAPHAQPLQTQPTHAEPPQQARPAPQASRPQASQPVRPTPQPQRTAPPQQRVAPARPAPIPPQRIEPARPAPVRPAPQPPHTAPPPQRVEPARPAAPNHAPPPSRPAPQSQTRPPEHRPDDKHPQ